MKKYITFGSPLIENKEISSVVKCLKSGWIGTGPKVQEFQKKFSDYKKIKNSIAVHSCSAALHLSLKSLNLKKNDEVITSALTFCSTVNSIILSGAKPVLADVDLDTQNIDPKDIIKKINKNTKAIIIVHFAGRPCDMDAIMKIVKNYKLSLIEDCAHAIESKYNGKHCGTFGSYGCFSFYATKNLVTGEGGMITTNQNKNVKKLKQMALHGMSKDAWQRYSDKGYKHYDVIDLGFKYNMTDIQASIGVVQLKKIEASWKKRKKIWNFYNNFFKDLNVIIPSKIERNTKHAYHLYTILISKKINGMHRDVFLQKMHDAGIGTGVHYRSIPSHSFYSKKYGWSNKNFKNACQIGDQTVSIPISAKLRDNDIHRITHAAKKILNDV
jgi:dTDP-4-amino-4,6-dideoxygalactose transaminase